MIYNYSVHILTTINWLSILDWEISLHSKIQKGLLPLYLFLISWRKKGSKDRRDRTPKFGICTSGLLLILARPSHRIHSFASAAPLVQVAPTATSNTSTPKVTIPPLHNHLTFYITDILTPLALVNFWPDQVKTSQVGRQETQAVWMVDGYILNSVHKIKQTCWHRFLFLFLFFIFAIFFFSFSLKANNGLRWRGRLSENNRLQGRDVWLSVWSTENWDTYSLIKLQFTQAFVAPK